MMRTSTMRVASYALTIAVAICPLLFAQPARAQSEPGPEQLPEATPPPPVLTPPPGIVLVPPRPAQSPQPQSCPDTGQKLDLVV